MALHFFTRLPQATSSEPEVISWEDVYNALQGSKLSLGLRYLVGGIIWEADLRHGRDDVYIANFLWSQLTLGKKQQSLMTATTVRREIPAARTEDPFELQLTASGEGSAVSVIGTPTSGPLEAIIRGRQGVDRSMSRIGPFPDHNTGFELGPGQGSRVAMWKARLKEYRSARRDYGGERRPLLADSSPSQTRPRDGPRPSPGHHRQSYGTGTFGGDSYTGTPSKPPRRPRRRPPTDDDTGSRCQPPAAPVRETTWDDTDEDEEDLAPGAESESEDEDAGVFLQQLSNGVESTRKMLIDGLTPSHAYTIVDLCEVEMPRLSFDSDARTVRMIKIRNPHGYIPKVLSPDDWGQGKMPDCFVYEWSPNSTSWLTKDARTMRVALGLASGQSLDKLLDQGEMWITFDAFLRYFGELAVSKVQIVGDKELDPPDPEFAARYTLSYKDGSVGADGPPAHRHICQAFEISVGSGTASLIVGAWSRHGFSRMELFLFTREPGGRRRHLTAVEVRSSRNYPKHDAVLTTGADFDKPKPDSPLSEPRGSTPRAARAPRAPILLQWFRASGPLEAPKMKLVRREGEPHAGSGGGSSSGSGKGRDGAGTGGPPRAASRSSITTHLDGTRHLDPDPPVASGGIGNPSCDPTQATAGAEAGRDLLHVQVHTDPQLGSGVATFSGQLSLNSGGGLRLSQGTTTRASPSRF